MTRLTPPAGRREVVCVMTPDAPSPGAGVGVVAPLE